MLFRSADSGQGGSNTNAAGSECPPAPKSGLSAIQRAGGIESFEKYGKWRTSLPPKSCAGDLASFIPDLPTGYGLPPNVRPPIVTDGHVHLRYVQIPTITGDQTLDTIGFADQPQFEFEIVQLTNDQATKFKDWFKKNKSSYTEYPIENRMFYAVGGGGWYLPGNKLTGGIGTILDNNVLIKFTMPKMYTEKSVAMPIVQMFHEVAEKNGF